MFPIQMLDNLSFKRALSWATTNGEEYLTLRTTDNGVLVLV
jgi:hypothetical protein